MRCNPESPDQRRAARLSLSWAIFAIAWWCAGLCCAAVVGATRPAVVNPRPAVARIAASEEGGAVSYGTGTLIDVRDQFGLVITNWHVVRDATGPVEVRFPGGFRSLARSLKVDSDWDLAALVIWRPPLEPVPIASGAPRHGDVLTICGWGQGTYREATGRCTQYLAPRIDFPREMVELNVEARQGDSGGPILNDRGELAGVLFGAGHGFTLGSFGGRVESFLASLAPDIGKAPATMVAEAEAEKPAQTLVAQAPAHDAMPADPSAASEATASNPSLLEREQAAVSWQTARNDAQRELPADASSPRSVDEETTSAPTVAVVPSPELATQTLTWRDIAGAGWFHQVRNFLALVGLIAIGLQLVRLVS